MNTRCSVAYDNTVHLCPRGGEFGWFDVAFSKAFLGLNHFFKCLHVSEDDGTRGTCADTGRGLTPKATITFNRNVLRWNRNYGSIRALYHTHEAPYTLLYVVAYPPVALAFCEGPGETCLDAPGWIAVETTDWVRKEIPDIVLVGKGPDLFRKWQSR